MGHRWSTSNDTTEVGFPAPEKPDPNEPKPPAGPFVLPFDLKGHNWRIDVPYDGYHRPTDALLAYGGSVAAVRIEADGSVTMRFHLGVQAVSGTDVSQSPLQLRLLIRLHGAIPELPPVVLRFSPTNAWNELTATFPLGAAQLRAMTDAGVRSLAFTAENP